MMTNRNPKHNYSVFTNTVALKGEGFIKGARITVHKAYKSDNPKTVADLESKGWMAAFFHGPKAVCKAEAGRRNGYEIRRLQEDIELAQAKISALRKASR